MLKKKGERMIKNVRKEKKAQQKQRIKERISKSRLLEKRKVGSVAFVWAH